MRTNVEQRGFDVNLSGKAARPMSATGLEAYDRLRPLADVAAVRQREQTMARFPALLVLAIWLGAATASAEQAGLATIESRYTYLNDCRELGRGDVDKGEDWVRHRCKGYGPIAIWLRYSDSARVYIGFGTRPNETSDMFSYDRDDAWPVEWRGHLANGSFQPFAAILRMRVPAATGGTTSLLVVHRLRSDGTSCTVGSTYGSNQSAREIADASRIQFKCEGETRLL